MKTLFKILRSITTSLLFIILTIAILIQFLFTTINIQNKTIKDMIDKKDLLAIVLDDKKINDERIKNILLEYIDDYIDYVFHKRSYPSPSTVDYDGLTEEEKKQAEDLIEQLNTKIDIDYDTVLKLRSINNFISNGSIYLLINIGLFTVFLITAIIKKSFKVAFKMLSLATVTGVLVLLIGGTILNAKLPNMLDAKSYVLVSNILNDAFLHSFLNQSLIYIGIGLILFLIVFAIDKFTKNTA